jgi:hypothetical protein
VTIPGPTPKEWQTIVVNTPIIVNSSNTLGGSFDSIANVTALTDLVSKVVTNQMGTPEESRINVETALRRTKSKLPNLVAIAANPRFNPITQDYTNVFFVG